MLGLDTNVLVRLLVLDDRAQTRRAQQIVQQAQDRGHVVWISLLVLIETEWVLRSRYGLDKLATVSVLARLLETGELSFEEEAAVEEALYNWKKGPCGFADCLIVARNRRAGCVRTVTFDKHAARLPGGEAA